MRKTTKTIYLVGICVLYGVVAFAQVPEIISHNNLHVSGQLILDKSENWLYKAGNDTAWAAKELDISNWKQFKPSELSIADADKTGRVEGWFRLKIKIDSSLKNQQLYFNKRTRDAATVYWNGQLIKSYGKIAPKQASFDSYIDNGQFPTAITLEPDSLYTLAIHTLDYTFMSPPRLISSTSGTPIFFEIVNQDFFDNMKNFERYKLIFKTIWIAVCTLLSLFFWFIVFLNPSEINLRLIAMCVTLGTFSTIGLTAIHISGISFEEWKIYFSGFLIAMFAYISFMPRVVAQIFTGTIPKQLNYLTAGLFLFGAVNVFTALSIMPMVFVTIISFSTIVYLGVKNWKTLKGAQWAFVFGILGTVFLMMMVVILAFLNDSRYVNIPSQVPHILTTGGFLALPLAMLVYTSLRFKEISVEVQAKAKDILRMSEEKATQLEKINAASAKFVPATFLNFLGKENILDATLGDYVEKQVSILFSDIRDYTTLSEQMTPAENFRFVNAYNQRMGPIIQEYSGFVNQYVGDGLMAIFPENTEHTLKAAIAMQQTLRTYNQRRKATDRPPIRMGIGIHAGPLIMGIIGDQKRMDAAIISDTVNAGSRVEGLTKYFGVNILLSEAVLDKLPNRALFNLRYLGLVQVKGKQEVIKIYECFDGDAREVRALKKQTLVHFEKGMTAYYQQDFTTAISFFEKVLLRNPKDTTSLFFKDKIEQLTQKKLPENWTGVELMDNK